MKTSLSLVKTIIVATLCVVFSSTADAQDTVAYETASRCIDFANLTAPGATCYYGSYANPRQHTGVVDNGPSQMSSRHTVNRTPGLTDPRTDNILPLIPQGEAVSVRLGNWDVNAEAEQIEYTFTPSPYSNAILLLKYAVVFQDPEHDSAPEFSIRITDAQGQSLGACTETTVLYTASALDSTWHQPSSDSTVWWKEWTSVGFNLSEFAGQTLKVVLTTKDCDMSGHYGYAYFTLNCTEAQITGLSCAGDPEIAVKVPDGFKYEWSLQSDSSHTVLSTAPVFSGSELDTSIYVCKLTSKIDTSCSFRLFASLLPRSPRAQFDPELTPVNCQNIVTFSNTSNVVTLFGVTREKPEYYEWTVVDTLNNDTILNRAGLESPAVVFPNEGGDYIIKLVAAISGGSCADTLIMPYHVPEINVVPDTIYAEICGGQIYNFNGTNLYRPGEYDARSVGGCDSLHLVLTVVDKIETDIYDTIFSGETYDFNGYSVFRSGVYKAKLTSSAGCDSVVTLHLTVLTGVDDVADESLIRVVPNPANAGQTALVSVFSTSPIARVEVINSLGAIISIQEPVSAPINLTAPAVAGVYHVRVTTTDGRVSVTKLIVQ